MNQYSHILPDIVRFVCELLHILCSEWWIGYTCAFGRLDTHVMWWGGHTCTCGGLDMRAHVVDWTYMYMWWSGHTCTCDGVDMRAGGGNIFQSVLLRAGLPGQPHFCP